MISIPLSSALACERDWHDYTFNFYYNSFTSLFTLFSFPFILLSLLTLLFYSFFGHSHYVWVKRVRKIAVASACHEARKRHHRSEDMLCIW
jgi:hypothetical protein